jgi:hypothetical protein
MPHTDFRVRRIVPGPGALMPFLASAASEIVRTLIGPPAFHMISRMIRGSSLRAKCGFGLWRRGGIGNSGSSAWMAALVSQGYEETCNGFTPLQLPIDTEMIFA